MEGAVVAHKVEPVRALKQLVAGCSNVDTPANQAGNLPEALFCTAQA